MADEIKDSQQPEGSAEQKGTDEITFIDLTKEGSRKLKVKASGEERELTLKEAVESYIPKGFDYTQKTQKMAGLYKKYGTEDVNELIDKVKAERDSEYIQMAGDPEYHKDFIDVFEKAGFELKINKKGEGKLVDKSTGQTLTPEELENLDPQTKRLFDMVQAQNEQITSLNQKLTEREKKEEADFNARIDKEIKREIADFKAKNPDVTDEQIGVLKTLSAIDTRMSIGKDVDPKSISQIYEEMKQTFGTKGKGMSEQDISALKAKWLDEMKNPQPQTEGAGKGSPATGEKLPQDKKELYDRLKREGVNVTPPPGVY